MTEALAHVTSDQTAVFDLMADPMTYGTSGPVVRFNTHGAAVFLAGNDAYKVKRAVHYPFLDYSTLAKRRAACEAELAVNRPYAPELYLGLIPITQSADGLTLNGSGEIVEWAVHMRRFDETQTLDHVASAGGLTPALVAKLVRAVLVSHRDAPLRDGRAATASLSRYLQQNNEAFLESPDLFPPERVQSLTTRARDTFAQVEDLLLSRGNAGYVRRCHGDLHLRNLVLLNGTPTLFDAIEFDDAIATGDVLYDLAFLLMDLWERGLTAVANSTLNRYLWESDDGHLSGLAAMPLFLSIRSGIRAKVLAGSIPHLAGQAREQATYEARRYFSFAERFLAEAPKRLIGIGGLSGTGKSTVSAVVAPFIGSPPGAVHLRSDIERKRLFGVAETGHLPSHAYDPSVSDDVYRELHRKASLALTAGRSVIIDAVHAREDERNATESVAEASGAPFSGFWLEAQISVLQARVTARHNDASDADAEVISRQQDYDLGHITWTHVDATASVEALVRRVLDDLKLDSGNEPLM